MDQKRVQGRWVVLGIFIIAGSLGFGIWRLVAF